MTKYKSTSDRFGTETWDNEKSFETEMFVDGKELPLNNFVQETIGNIMAGFSKSLKGLEVEPETIEVKIKRLPAPADVDAYVYP